MDISKIFPITQLYQGDTWRFSVSAQDYDPSLWTITYVFRKVGQAAFSISSANVDNAFSFEVLPAVSAAYTPGLYSVSAVLSNLAGDRFTAGSCEIQIKPDVSSLDNGDPRTANRIALDTVEAALAAGAGSDVVEYTIAGSTFKKDRKGLLDLRSFYLRRVRAELGLPAIGRILYNF